MNTEQLIDQLCLPQTYPHAVEVITTIETHISMVFLTGQYAYKLKKPVDFGFLNFTQKQDRKKFCLQELRLNKRTAPDLYLDVVPIFEGLNGTLYLGDSNALLWQPPLMAEPLDYLVKMRQFEPSAVLGRYLTDHGLSRQQESLLAKQIARLHLDANQVASNTHLGEPETLLKPMLDNFPTLFKNADKLDQPLLEQLFNWTHSQFKLLHAELVDRKQSGFVRECHGDLHLDNIALINQVPTLFDGIEFNDEFRWIDGISDVAFLLIDLDFREQPGIKRRLLSDYMRITGDYSALKLLRFYCVYRALVRAKISALRLMQLDKKTIEYQHFKRITSQYIEQAKTEAFERKPPQLILLQGVSGSGKSFLSLQLLDHIEAIVISSDIERKRLFGVDALERVAEHKKTTLYSNSMNRKTYQRLQSLAKQILQLGMSVIVDATFLKTRHRQPFYKLAESLGYACKTVYIQTDQTTAQHAIQLRQSLNDNPSDADISVMLKQLKIIEEPVQAENTLVLKADQLRHFFPVEVVKAFLDESKSPTNTSSLPKT